MNSNDFTKNNTKINAHIPDDSTAGSGLIIFAIFGFVTLLLLGVLKGVLGILWRPAVGIWGLDMILIRPHKMRTYYEDNLKNRSIIYDEFGWPIHPDTRQRSVRCLHPLNELCMNAFFFFVYPIALLLKCVQGCQRLCDLIQNSEGSDDNDKSNLIPTKRFSDRRRDKNEGHDMEYVINTLKDSKKSLARIRSDLIIPEISNKMEETSNVLIKKMNSNATSMRVQNTRKDPKALKQNWMASQLTSERDVYLSIDGSTAMTNGAKRLDPLQLYSIKGSLFKLEDDSWSFIPKEPLWQYWVMNPGDDDRSVIPLEIPHKLESKKFTTQFNSLTDLIDDGRISLFLKNYCINDQFEPGEDCCCSTGTEINV